MRKKPMKKSSRRKPARKGGFFVDHSGTFIRAADSATRKSLPLFSGVLRYFPDALLEVAELSRVGNDKHNPGEPLHWAKEKSNDHDDCVARHLLDAGTRDPDGIRHRTSVAWRALAALQTEIEADRAARAKRK